jgi:hypothetical protein
MMLKIIKFKMDHYNFHLLHINNKIIKIKISKMFIMTKISIKWKMYPLDCIKMVSKMTHQD